MEGQTLEEMKIELVSHMSFYERVGNNPSYFIAQMIQLFTGRTANAAEISQWTNRLMQLQNREAVVREFVAMLKNQGQIR